MYRIKFNGTYAMSDKFLNFRKVSFLWHSTVDEVWPWKRLGRSELYKKEGDKEGMACTDAWLQKSNKKIWMALQIEVS